MKDRPVIIVCDEDDSGCLVVCTTTDSSIYMDGTTLLLGGFHLLIDKDCHVAYGHAKHAVTADLDKFRQAIAAGSYRFDPIEKLSAADLSRVQAGFDAAQGIPLEERDIPIEGHRYAKDRGIV